MSEERQKEVTQRLNEVLAKDIEGGKLGYDHAYQFQINIGFDKEEPIQYVYVSGEFSIQQVKDEKEEQGFRNTVIRNMQYIEISDNADNFIDRGKDLNECEHQVSLEGNVFTKPKIDPNEN